MSFTQGSRLHRLWEVEKGLELENPEVVSQHSPFIDEWKVILRVALFKSLPSF